VNRTVRETAAAALDAESAEWVQALAGTGSRREEATARLHGLLVRIALADAGRRGPRLRITGPELEDLAYQAAADALLAITAKLGQFRGESRFTTWAYKFVIFEVSAKLGRHFWRHPAVRFDAEDWDRLPDRFGVEPEREAEWTDEALMNDWRPWTASCRPTRAMSAAPKPRKCCTSTPTSSPRVPRRRSATRASRRT
jgi:DNA-directed RNA polymerase specialized sigma24 family protein